MDNRIETAPAADQATATEEPADGAWVPTGKIEGGWGYVGAAYGITFLLLLAYVLVTTVRLRGLENRHGRS